MDKYTIKYSIIIPVYQSANYIHSCIDSILNQEITNFEIILIDDGSPDKSGAICDAYQKKDTRIKVIHKHNEGVSIARNIGIKASSGEWISFVDSDDCVTSNYLSDFDKIEKKADLNYFGNENFTDKGTLHIYKLPKEKNEGKENIEKCFIKLKYNQDNFEFYGYVWNKFYRASIIKKNNIQFIPHLNLREDEIFVNDYAQYISSVMTMDHVGYRYRQDYKSGLTGAIRNSSMWNLYIENKLRNVIKYTNKDLISIEIQTLVLDKYLSALSEERIINSIKGVKETISYAKEVKMQKNNKIIYKKAIKIFNYNDSIKNKLLCWYTWLIFRLRNNK